MLLQAEIQKVKPLKMDDGAMLYEVAVTDKSRPAVFRTPGTFVVWLGQEALDKLGKGDLTDTKVTLAVNSISVQNGNLKIRGTLYPGHASGEQLEKQLVEPDKAPVKTAA